MTHRTAQNTLMAFSVIAAIAVFLLGGWVLFVCDLGFAGSMIVLAILYGALEVLYAVLHELIWPRWRKR